jgi:hypothetical protein
MPHRTFLKASWLLAGVIALFFTGCQGGYDLGGISINLDHFTAPSEASSTMTLRYTNENTIPIALSGSAHKVYLNGTYVGKAVSKQPLGLAALSTITQDATVNFENLAFVKQLVATSDQKSASYRVESVLYITSGEENLTIKTNGTGSVDLRALSSTKP